MKTSIVLPELAPGHWDTKEGFDMANVYLKKTRKQLSHGHLKDRDVVAIYHSQTLSSPSLIVWQTVIKERIRWLSVQALYIRLKRIQRDGSEGNTIPLSRHHLLMGHMSDFRLANEQFMVSRDDSDAAMMLSAGAMRLSYLYNQYIFETRALLRKKAKNPPYIGNSMLW